LVPQIGWNQIYDLKSDLFKGIPEQTYAYLVHSYYVAKNENTIATTDYSQAYSTALQKDNFFGVQFHPEKSGILGSKMLENFLKL
jgi:glutamine amidotransferase